MARTSILSGGAPLAAARPYDERSEEPRGWHDRLAELLFAVAVRPAADRISNPAKRLARIVEMTDRHEERLRTASDAELRELAGGMRSRLRREGFTAEGVGECFALVREAAARTLGKRHYASQLQAGWGLLQGRMVEMETGEGKTFAATLPACTVALSGYPVHVVTVNDYLAERDAEEMGPLYRFLGLATGVVVQGMSREERRDAYARAITYCTNKELAFDYLRDRTALARRSSRLHLALEGLRGDASRGSDLVLRGLHYCIVDEADSVFIDEARTPLILAAAVPADDELAQCNLALDFAARLAPGEDYEVDFAQRSVTLTEDGKEKLAGFAEGLDGHWVSARAREELLSQALTARILFLRDQHYVVSEGKVQIVDESTGRVMADRSWERGLHQLIEAKEGCELTERRETIARLTYQRLLRRYLRLSGMSGTAKEVAREISTIYRLDVVRVPLHRPSRRMLLGARTFLTLQEKWIAVADSVERMVREQRPVLIGTRSVKASEEISAVLAGRGVAHALLNAKQDKAEAEVIGQAGQPGRVTVATNMAGRGTDIHLGEGVAERGGLHVILTEYHESRRVDRQLYGRCGRQGDPGSCEAIVSLEDDVFLVNAPRATQVVRGLVEDGKRVPAAVYAALRAFAQHSAERRSAQVRIQNLRLDQRLEQVLSFSGRGE